MFTPMLRALTVAFAVGLLTRCGKPLGPDDVDGIYILRSINGQDLPVAVIPINPMATIEITAGSVRLNSDNTFSASQTIEITQGGTTTITTLTSAATYTLYGTAITFVVDEWFGFPSPNRTGSITGSTLTIERNVYRE